MNNIVEFARPRLDASKDLPNQDLSSPVHQLTVMRRLSREWRAILSDREYAVLSYIIDHTVCWGRQTYRFTYRSLSEGTSVSPAGLNKTKKQLTEVLRALERLGVITIAPNKRDGLTITPNLRWKPSFAVPKRLQGGAENQPSEGVKSNPQREGFPSPLLEEHFRGTDRRTVAPASAVAGSDNPLKLSEQPKATYRVRSRPTGNLLAKPEPEPTAQPSGQDRPRTGIADHGEFSFGDAQRVAKGPLAPANPQTAASARETASRTLKNPGALQRTWTAAWGRAFDEVPGAVCPAWTKTEMGMVKSALAARWTQDAASLHGFLEWIVTDWSNIVGTHFAWMKRDPAPSLPSIRFVMTFKDRFFQAWNRRTVDKAIDGLSGEERRRRELMMRQGKTLEEANLLIAEERAQVRLRDEIEAGKKRAASMLQEARLTKDSTERMLRQPHARRNVVPLMPSPVTPAWELTEQEYTDTAALLGDLMKTMETNNQAQFQGA